jgi:hypothetical protein
VRTGKSPRVSRVPAAWALAVAALVLAGCAAGLGSGKPVDGEPAYCLPAAFHGREIPVAAEDGAGLSRLHAYRLGKVLFAGLAVGESEQSKVRALAQRHSSAPGPERFCTWYVNRGNPEAAGTFVFRYVPNPSALGEREAAAAYLDVLRGSLLDDPEGFLACAADHGYIAVGCDGMRHRGPTAFGMVLTFSGCEPGHALQIVNDIWGLNGVPEGVRLAILRAAHELGRANPAESARLRDLFTD